MVMPLDSHRSSTHVRVSSCCSTSSANMRISLAIMVAPGISASIVLRTCRNSSAAKLMPKKSHLKLFMRVSD